MTGYDVIATRPSNLTPPGMTGKDKMQVARSQNIATPELDTDRQALFLDLDGTLLEIQADPAAVAADDALLDLLDRLHGALDGALAVVTGRSLSQADRILRGRVAIVAGLHGREFRIGEERFHDAVPLAPVAAARAEVEGLLAAGALDIRVEDKGSAFALHYRHAPDQAGRVTRLADALARRHGLHAIHGKMVAELVSGPATKGTAVARLMREPAFAGRMPVALGDDVTDEEAFATCAALGGFGVLVGDRQGSMAPAHLAGVAAVHAWLRAGLARRHHA
ncbi:trehalose-phosphatase [Zavarzinia sp. CC-PAN008]|uniref:trehalose-phosphatase n=1 Tax=Zavarzinia sp. CC-PAN008 TaxID=3243332 RepID=UPI003F743CF3